MSFYIFSAGSIAYASEVMENFFWTRQTDVLPRGGQSMTAADSTYDIGNSNFRWKDVYTNSISVTDSTVISSQETWLLLSEAEISVAASSVEFTGLNGDDNLSYRLDVYHIDVDAATNLQLTFNGDSGTNYTYYRLEADGNTVTTNFSTDASYILLTSDTRYQTTTAIKSFSTSYMWLESDEVKRTTIKEVSSMISVSVGHAVFGRGVWVDTSNTVTSMKITSSVAGNLGVGTKITLWGKS